MKFTRAALLVVAIFGLAPGCSGPLAQLREGGLRRSVIVLENASVIDLASRPARVLAGRRIVVVDGRIAGIASGARSTGETASNASIDLQGRFVLPGLADMHVHIADERDLALYIANGVTTIRSMGESVGMGRWMGFPEVRALRERVRTGELPGPRIYSAGPILEGQPATSPAMLSLADAAAAAEAARQQAATGYDLLKIYDHLSAAQYQAIVHVSQQSGVAFGGHVPFAIDPERAIQDNIRSIEHLSGWIDNDRVRFRVPRSEWRRLAQLSRQRRVYNVPTLVIFDRIVPLDRFDEVVGGPEERYLPWRMRLWWYMSLRAVLENAGNPGPEYAAAVRAMMLELTGFLHRQGAPIVAGTDASFVGVYPGFSLHGELARLVEAGLSPEEALRASTLTAAEMMRAEGQWACLQPGCSADLVVLNRNPLETIENTRSIEAVMARGVYFDRRGLDALLRAAE